MSGQRLALHTILSPGGIRTIYQPVYRVRDQARSIHYLECLSRGPIGTNMEPPNVMFDYVRRKREESLVDRACLTVALNSAAKSKLKHPLSVNVHASTLGRDHGFVQFLIELSESSTVPLNRVTIEIVEHAPPWDNLSFAATIDKLRELGVRIALDDVGLGQSNYKMILDVCPDYLKIDRYFVTGLAVSEKRKAVIGSIQHLANRFGAEIVAEGVETEDDLKVLGEMGIELVQGFLLGRGMAAEEIEALSSPLDSMTPGSPVRRLVI